MSTQDKSNDLIQMSKSTTDFLDKLYSPSKIIKTFSDGLNKNLAGGLHPGILFTIEGAPDGSKSTFAQQIIEKAADEYLRVLQNVDPGMYEFVIANSFVKPIPQELLLRLRQAGAGNYVSRIMAANRARENRLRKLGRADLIEEYRDWFFVRDGIYSMPYGSSELPEIR